MDHQSIDQFQKLWGNIKYGSSKKQKNQNFRFGFKILAEKEGLSDIMNPLYSLTLKPILKMSALNYAPFFLTQFST